MFLTIPFFFISCSYGIFNFAEEKGDLELRYEITTDNGAGIDSVIFELTPPDGSGMVSFSKDIYGSSAYVSVSDMITGTWSLSAAMKAGDEVFQTYDSSLEIVNGEQTDTKIQAGYNGTSFDIIYTSQIQEDSTDTTDDGTTDFTAGSFYLNPELYLEFRSSELISIAGLHVTGSGLVDSVRRIELEYPDGAEYFIGETDEIYSRDIIYTYSASDSLVEMKRTYLPSVDDINGTYVLKMEDYSSHSIREELTGEYGDIESKIPVILGHDNNDTVPEWLDRTVSHDFQWELSDSSRAGTIIAFVISQSNSGTFYPTTDAELIQPGTSGEFLIPNETLAGGNYYFIIAAVEEVFTTPIADALAASITPDLRPSTFAESVRSIYGSDAGLITISFVDFEYSI